MKAQLIKVLTYTAAVAAVVLSTTATAQMGSESVQMNLPDRPRVIMPDGPVRAVIRDNCTACHGIDDYAYHAFNRNGWNQLIDEKHSGDQSVEITSADREILLEYLETTFGGDYIALPREYSYEPSDSFSDQDGRVFLEVFCTGCHEHSSYVAFNLNHTEEEWRFILTRERNRLEGIIPLDAYGRLSEFPNDFLEKAAAWLAELEE